MKRIFLVLGLIWLLMACEKSDLLPKQEFAAPSAARIGANERPGEPSSLFTGKSKITTFTVSKNRSGKFDLIFQYDRNEAETVSGITLAEVIFINDLLRVERPQAFELNRKQIDSWTMQRPEAPKMPDLFDWLIAHPRIANSISWQEPTGTRSWPSWSGLQQIELWIAFVKCWEGNSIAVADVPTNQLSRTDNAYFYTVLSAADAWAYYKASVAQSLVVEIKKLVGWSVLNYPVDQLGQLFDSRDMFWWQADPAGYFIRSDQGWATPSAPWRSYKFLKDNSLITNNRLHSTHRLLDWCRSNLMHFEGPPTAGNAEDIWRYRGYPPIIRILNGTIDPNVPVFGKRHWTAGCWGTVGFLRAILRTINVPVQLVRGENHAQAWFMADGLYLPNGDDPYIAKLRDPSIPIHEFLISQSTFTEWFGSGISLEIVDKHLSRNPEQLAIKYLSLYLMVQHCKDKAEGKSHAQSEVYQSLKFNYTLAQLEAMNLWGKLDQKIAAKGGCSVIYTAYHDQYD
ncbi:hypothetical protein GCM10027299_41850 [Larkinella ripae]